MMKRAPIQRESPTKSGKAVATIFQYSVSKNSIFAPAAQIAYRESSCLREDNGTNGGNGEKLRVHLPKSPIAAGTKPTEF
jgi:hypothetical protein